MQASGNSKNTWKVINKVLRPGEDNLTNKDSLFYIDNQLSCDSVKIADEFNKYYVNVGVELSSKVPIVNRSCCDYVNDGGVEAFSFLETNEDEVRQIVHGLSNSSPGADDIPTKVLKQTITPILTPLLHILNQSLKTGVVPNKLKVAKVIPLHKKESKQHFKNYRPISILPAFSKVLEKVVTIRLTSHLEANGLLSNSQFGFREKRSTTSAILNLTDYILDSFKEYKHVVGVFLDLAKAFETVSHEILLKKLECIGVTGISGQWFSNYLSGRTQYIHYADQNSSPLNIPMSIPQGSILGPVLFCVYINDIVNSLKMANITLFADDTCVYYAHKNIDTLINTLNSELTLLNDWFSVNKLTLNLSKSHYVIFSRRNYNIAGITQLRINNIPLSLVNSTLFLGIYLDRKLSWGDHISYLTKKLNKYRAILFLTRDSLTINSIKLIYNSLIYQNLLYGNIVWGRASKSKIKPLEIAQRNIVRTMMFRSKYSHTHNDFASLKLFKINDINFFSSCMFVYKSINQLTYPINYFNFNDNVFYNLRDNSNLRINFRRTNQGQSSPSFYGCHDWNSLPVEIRQAPTLPSFKKSLKDYILNNY